MAEAEHDTWEDRPDAVTKRYLGLGPHRVRVFDEFEVCDSERGKRIPVKAYYPEFGGPYPVIVFSHGAGDSNDSAPHLMRHWASHGYVVLLPTHFFGERPRIERSLARLGRELLRPARQGPSAWYERVGDLRAVIDALPTVAAIAPELHEKVDPSRVGIAGHSFGAYTVMLMGGATLTDKDGSILRFDDPRPQAVLMISGPGHDSWGLTEESYIAMTRPLMVFAGSHDRPPSLASDSMWRAEAYTCGPAGNKFLVYIRGANHLSYIGPIFDFPLRDPRKRGPIARAIRRCARRLASFAPSLDQVGIFDYTRIASTAFWDAYLKDDTRASVYLRSSALHAYSRGVARLKHK
jgi:predicted dienelactone hydrolase